MDVVVKSRNRRSFRGVERRHSVRAFKWAEMAAGQNAYRYVYKYMPRVKILRDGSRYCLAVDGMERYNRSASIGIRRG